MNLFGKIILCVLASMAGALAQSFEVRTHTLKNGMKILVHEDDSIPNVALYVFYRIGSRNERPGTTGLSHFFEHMMFNGAKKYGPKEFDVVMEAAGGANNAYTDRDVTVYQDWFPASAMPLIFELEADRIAHLSFDPKMIESERGVVASERRTSVEANNIGLLDEQLWATAFVAHPYQWPVIGWMVDIENWKMADLKHHFEIGYSPANATMVLSGAVKFEEVIELSKRYLEAIEPRPLPPPVTTKEPEQLGERRVKVVKFAQSPSLMVSYHVPPAAHGDYYALQVLRNILSVGNSSRLYQRLVDRDQLAIEVDAQMGLALDPTLFSTFVQPREGISLETVEKVLHEEIERVKHGGVLEREVQKARNSILAEFYRTLKSISGKSQLLGNYEIFFGDYRKLFTVAGDVAKVTAQDVQRVAQEYFAENHRTVAMLIPEPRPNEATTGSKDETRATN
jgi:zinc protease